MLLQRLATGATGVKQARYRRGPTRCSEALVRACAVYTACLLVYHCVALAVQCETTHGVYEFRRGFCTSVLSFASVLVTLVHRESVVGEGTVCCSRESVHGHVLTANELCLVVTALRWSRKCGKRLPVSSNSFAYWLFHAITFSRKVFSKIHESKSKKSLRETREYRCLLVSTDAEAEQTDTQTDRQTHTTTTVTLAHARRGLTTRSSVRRRLNAHALHVRVCIHDLIPFVGEGKERERATCPRICASSSVVRPREREATETAEEREAS